MSTGLRVYGAGGEVLLEVTDRVLRVIHVERVLVTAPPRTISIPGLVQGRAWAVGHADDLLGSEPLAEVYNGYLIVQGGGYGRPPHIHQDISGYITVVGYG